MVGDLRVCPHGQFGFIGEWSKPTQLSNLRDFPIISYGTVKYHSLSRYCKTAEIVHVHPPKMRCIHLVVIFIIGELHCLMYISLSLSLLSSSSLSLHMNRCNNRVGMAPSALIRKPMEVPQVPSDDVIYESHKSIYEGLNLHKPPPRRSASTFWVYCVAFLGPFVVTECIVCQILMMPSLFQCPTVPTYVICTIGVFGWEQCASDRKFLVLQLRLFYWPKHRISAFYISDY